MLVMVIVLWEMTIALVVTPVSAGHVLITEIDPAVTLFVVALGVPVGFVMNQIYFAVLDGLLPFMRFLAVPLDRGAQILRHLHLDQLAYLRENTSFELDMVDDKVHFVRGWIRRRFRLVDNTIKGRRAYARVRRQNWRAVLWLMLHGVSKDHGDALRAEYGARADTYHALGGCRYAVATATALVATYNLVAHRTEILDDWVHTLIIVSLIASGTFLLLVVISRARHNTLTVLQEVIMDSLRSGIRVD